MIIYKAIQRKKNQQRQQNIEARFTREINAFFVPPLVLLIITIMINIFFYKIDLFLSLVTL